jgi:hypothetical protein
LVSQIRSDKRLAACLNIGSWPSSTQRSSCLFVSDEDFGEFVAQEREIVRRNQVLVRGQGCIDPSFDPRIIEKNMHGLEKLPQVFRKNQLDNGRTVVGDERFTSEVPR